MKARIYTKTGDKGQTSLVGGTRVSKGDSRLEAYGTLDELNSSLGLIRTHLAAAGEFGSQVEPVLQTVQNSLFNIGSHLACEDSGTVAKLPALKPEALTALEQDMDRWESELPLLRNFILPGGGPLAAASHFARTICRRAERDVVRLSENAPVDAQHIIYLNRLSDWLFLLARKANHCAGIKDANWEP
jgi:cob(I)alamin adenosyltransferase